MKNTRKPGFIKDIADKPRKFAAKSKKKSKRESRLVFFLVRVLPEALTGKKQVMEQRFRAAYVSGAHEDVIRKARNETMSWYLMGFVMLAISAIVIIWAFGEPQAGDGLKRPGFGGELKTAEKMVEAEYGGKTVKLPAMLRILPREPEPDEISAMLADLRKRLPGIILGGNTATDSITQDLVLPQKDEKTGIDISWQSDNEDVISPTGRVNLLEGRKGDKITLTAGFRCGAASDEMTIPIKLGAPAKSYDFSRDIKLSINGLLENLNADRKGDRMALPTGTDSGITIRWADTKDMTPLVLPLICIFIFIFAFRRRYSMIDRNIRAFRESISKEFPDFLGKLILLINAGMVVTAAVGKIAADYRERCREGEEKGFYEELCGIEDRMRGSNTRLTVEFADMANRSGRREIMRFSAILADNIDKGSALAEKLASENDMLWNLRKKRAEERGKLAETKLTFPMALQLLAVMLITVAPAAFEMN